MLEGRAGRGHAGERKSDAVKGKRGGKPLFVRCRGQQLREGDRTKKINFPSIAGRARLCS